MKNIAVHVRISPESEKQIAKLVKSTATTNAEVMRLALEIGLAEMDAVSMSHVELMRDKFKQIKGGLKSVAEDKKSGSKSA